MHELLTRFLEEVRGSWRFRWRGLLVAWVIAVAGFALVYWLPNEYTSKAQVHVDTQSLLRPLLHGLAVEPNINTQVELMTETLLSNENLEKIAQTTGMVSPSQSPVQRQLVLRRLKGDIGLAAEGNDLYTIGYTNPSPKRAEDVVRVVLNILMETTLGSTQQDSRAARRFLQTQVAHYGERLQADEARLAKFRRNHLELIPSQGGSDYFQRMNKAEQKLSNLREDLYTIQAQRRGLVSEIDAMSNGQVKTALPNAQVQALDKEIEDARKQLNDLLLTYTSRYPGVIDLRQNIKRLKAERAKAAKKGTSQRPGDLSANPVYQKLEITLNQTDVAIDTLKFKITQQERSVADLKAKAGQMTTVEAKLADLTRNYTVTQKQYQALLSRLDSAQLSGDMQHSGAQVKFQVINPPQLPLYPSRPNRVLLLAVVLVASLLGGCGFAFFLHQVKPVFINRSLLASITGRPVLGSVSMVMSKPQLRKARRRAFEFACAVVLLVAVLGVGMVVTSQLGTQWIKTFVQGVAL